MKKKVIYALVLLSLMALGSVCFEQSTAQSQGNITINSDGSVNPSTAPIQQTGNTYTLTGNMGGHISVKKNNIILDGNASTLSGGLSLDNVSNVTVRNFIIKGGEQFGSIPRGLFAGIYLRDTSNVVVANNTIAEISNFLAVFEYYETVAGIIVAGGHSNIISGNILNNNFEGMEFSNTAYNLIVGNNIICNSAFQNEQGYHDPAGIYFDQSSNNSIYHNTFKIGIGAQAGVSYSSVNIWDDGYPSGGNYWLNYNAREIGGSGIGDKPYLIDANNTDRYPLIEPFNYTFFTLQMTPPRISIQSPTNQTYNESSILLVFSVDKKVNWMSYSLDNQQNLTITGNSTIADVTNGVHNITVYSNDTFGNIGVTTISFTVDRPQPFPTIIVLIIISTIAVIIGVGALIYFRRKR